MGEDMKLSVIMAFYNRQNLLDKTLESFEKSKVKDYELIIVDDASDIPLVCPTAKVIRVEPKDKWYHNPCIPYNMAIKASKGDIIVIQNPECYYVGDVLAYIEENIKPNLYFSFAAYSITQPETVEFHNGVFPEIKNVMSGSAKTSGWFNHSEYRPKGYHFCSAIMRTDLSRMGGGFDERYAYGVAFDDDALIRSIRRAQIEVRIINSPYVIHQYHHHFTYEDPKVWKPLHTINQNLFNEHDGVRRRVPAPKRRKISYPYPEDILRMFPTLRPNK